MDGGYAQKGKADEVKREVKAAAARRRGTLQPVALESTESVTAEDPSFAGEPTPQIGPTRALAQTPPHTASTLNHTPERFWDRLDTLSQSKWSLETARNSELDRRFMIFYLDHFFPFLFPFYQPPLLEGGRSWILEIALRNEAMWHTTLCLSTYFVSVALDGSASGHRVCKNHAEAKLLAQLGVTFTMLHRDLQETTSSPTQDLMVNNARTMGNIIQLQRFEVSIGNFDNCRKHLDAAITLFRQVFRTAQDATENGLVTFDGMLNYLDRPIWTINSQRRRAWSSDQAAFRFYTALLVVDDIISSIYTPLPPKLFDYHVPLLKKDHNSGERPPLSLEDFVGCANWVMLEIGEISALDAWKKLMRERGQLDTMQLVARASPIKQTLLSSLAHLDATSRTPVTDPLNLFTSYNNQLPSMPGGCTAFVTRVWAHAALLYLSITVSGWQPSSAAIRENVTRTLALLEQMPTPELLRTMVWPFCIVGCLAAPEEEPRFRAMADALVPYQLFGAARKALEIMEKVWKCRDELTIDTDFAGCVCNLGQVSALV
jgi:hypothetical protein